MTHSNAVGFVRCIGQEVTDHNAALIECERGLLDDDREVVVMAAAMLWVLTGIREYLVDFADTIEKEHGVPVEDELLRVRDGVLSPFARAAAALEADAAEASVASTVALLVGAWHRFRRESAV